jgi:hypothetical protein
MNNVLVNNAIEKLNSMTKEELVASLEKHGLIVKKSVEQEWFYSTDGEEYNHREIEEAIDDVCDNVLEGETPLGRIVYCGVGIKPEPIELCDAADIIDTLADRAWDWGGEHADGFPNVSKEATDELNELLKLWYNKHLSVDFWRIDTKTVKEYVITEEDVKERYYE